SIALGLEGAEYVPDQFPGVIYRLKAPKTAILLFHSGKLVCTGAKSMREVETSIATVAQQIKKLGQRITLHPKIEVQNIVASSDLESEINLNAVAVTLGLDRIEYEPEQFPGLVCRIDEPKVVVLLFGTGKLVCTGGRKPSDIEVAVEKIAKELQDAGLLRRERGRAKPTPTRSSRGSQPSTGGPVSASPAPAPLRSSPDADGTHRVVVTQSPPSSLPRFVGFARRRRRTESWGQPRDGTRHRAAGRPPNPGNPEILGHYGPSSTPGVSLECRS
ncbi:MAG: hypothetical protein WB984_04425, partial [Thermoplasmata archaeon]